MEKRHCINKGGNLVFGDDEGNTVFLRTGEAGDVPEAIYQAHKDKLKTTKDKDVKPEEFDKARAPEVVTTQQREESTRPIGRPRGGKGK